MKITILKDGVQIAVEAESHEIEGVKQLVETALKGPEFKEVTALKPARPTLAKYPDGIDYTRSPVKPDMRYYKPQPDVYAYKTHLKETKPEGFVGHSVNCSCEACLVTVGLASCPEISKSVPVTTLDGIKGYVSVEDSATGAELKDLIEALGTEINKFAKE